ncbi:MAG: 50S ribosomal protein L11 methyltransferase [Saezia sp.]
MQNSLYELILSVPLEQVESVSDALMELNALSVSVEDADAGGDQEQPIFGEPNMPPPAVAWNTSTIKALFNAESEAVEAATMIMAQSWSQDIKLQSIQTVEEQNWVQLTQSQFDPIEVTPEFWIVPSWHEPPSQATHVIRLDPGMAFGTGTHPTTHMCLQWIAKNANLIKNKRVLDYGCGSGILAIAAALHGAKTVEAVDIDEAAVTTTQQNSMENNVQLHIGFPDQVKDEYNIVLANILATPLKLLAPLLCQHVSSGGHLVLAGILEWQAEELRQAYAPWVTLNIDNTLDGWILMTASK